MTTHFFILVPNFFWDAYLYMNKITVNYFVTTIGTFLYSRRKDNMYVLGKPTNQTRKVMML